MSRRRRVFAFAALAAACIIGIAVSIATGLGRDESPLDGAADATLQGARDVILFRSRVEGDGNGQLAVVPIDDPGRKPVPARLRCDRGYFAGASGLCVTRGSGFAAGYRAQVFDDRFRERAALPLEGLPSRARVSPDGRYGTVTMFVAGHSYAEAGAFSTQTTLIDLRRGEELGDLEAFTVTRGQRQVTATDRNFWGVTFARDSDRFYATMATGGKTYLIAGSVAERTARVIHENVECPSLSPDGRRIAYKRRTGSKQTHWRLTVLDLASMREQPLAETRSVDDQAEWLDDGTVLYGLGGSIWSVRADGGGAPRQLIRGGDSPAVVRAAS